MAKYGPGLSIYDVRDLEVEEATGILKDLNASDEQIDAITGMIKEAYFQFKKMTVYENAVIELAKEHGVSDMEIMAAFAVADQQEYEKEMAEEGEDPEDE